MWARIEQQFSPSHCPSYSRPRILLLCHDDELRTALGFRLACEAAAHGEHAVFICRKFKFEKAFPLPVTLQPEGAACCLDPATLSRVAIKYVSSAQELRRVGALLHTLQPTPNCVVVDHVASIVDPIGTTARTDQTFLEACMTSAAFLASACDHFDTLPQQEHQGGGHHPRPPCRLVITADCFEAQFQAAMRRGMQLIHVGYGPATARPPPLHPGAAAEVCLKTADNKEIKLFQCTKAVDPTSPAGQQTFLYDAQAVYQ